MGSLMDVGPPSRAGLCPLLVHNLSQKCIRPTLRGCAAGVMSRKLGLAGSPAPHAAQEECSPPLAQRVGAGLYFTGK